MEERKTLIAGGNLLQAHTWKRLLGAWGIHGELRGEALLGGVGELPANLHNVELWVRESQLANAQAQLSGLDVVSPQWECVQCHEMNEGCLELCWHCSAARSESQN